jgi:hypothetical protein
LPGVFTSRLPVLYLRAVGIVIVAGGVIIARDQSG